MKIMGIDISAFTETLTNKTLTSPVFNTGVSGSAIDTDEDLTANSDILLASQKAVKAYVDAVPVGAYSKTLIKVMPSEFMSDDGRGSNYAIIEDDTTDVLGVRVGHSSVLLYAFVKIPIHYKATHVQVYSDASTVDAVEVYQFSFVTGATLLKGTGNLDASIDIADITSSASADLVIKILPASNSTLIYGAAVTIIAV